MIHSYLQLTKYISIQSLPLLWFSSLPLKLHYPKGALPLFRGLPGGFISCKLSMGCQKPSCFVSRWLFLINNFSSKPCSQTVESSANVVNDFQALRRNNHHWSRHHLRLFLETGSFRVCSPAWFQTFLGLGWLMLLKFLFCESQSAPQILALLAPSP